ncbi:hypothetical protein AS158_07310 [Thermotoga sp. 38H-to]|nr:hypothetical protein AS158_07310 [Thermotoga sp. 38H-to]
MLTVIFGEYFLKRAMVTIPPASIVFSLPSGSTFRFFTSSKLILLILATSFSTSSNFKTLP